MKARTISLVCLSLLLITGAGQTAAPSKHSQNYSQKVRLISNYGSLPLAFEANQGQVDSGVKFLSRGAGYGLYLTRDEAVLTLRQTALPRPQFANSLPLPKEQSAVLRMKLVDANHTAAVFGEDELASKTNYFIGNDPKKWQTDVRQYSKVRYRNIYPGIDLVYYGNQRELEYDFVVQPGADAGAIRLAIEGVSQLKIVQTDIVMNSSAGDVRLRCPHVYQKAHGKRVEIPARYITTSKNEVAFQIAAYDRGKPLVIDPVLSYATYLGGSGDERPVAITIDAAGNAYVTGGTTSLDFPVANPFQPDFHGGVGDSFGEGDAFVSKLSPDGSSLIYSTYLGGSQDELGQAIAVDSTGIYLTGFTASDDFPTVNAVQSSHQGWRNAFVTKINASGNALVYSTYLGGGEDYGWGLAVDSSGRAHVRGDTRSGNFPVVNAIQPTLRSHALFNCFVSEFSADGKRLLYSTYWGGSGGEGGVGLSVDSVGNTYIGGYTLSTDFPTINPIQPTLAGGLDGFITKFSPDGQTVIYSTFLGGSGDEWSEGFTVDPSGNAYIVGNTSSIDFPVVNAIQATYSGGIDAFLAKVNPAGNALVYSTYLGGSAEDHATGIAVDSSGSAYIAGHTLSADFPVFDPIQALKNGGRDAFLTKISANGSNFFYSTFLGGSADEGGNRNVNVVADSAGNAYLTGVTWSTDFPFTPGAFQTFSSGGADAFVVRIVSDTAPPAITVAARPQVLWPPNGKMVPVRIFGRITDAGSGVKPGSARYTVQDEYQLIKSQGTITLASNGNFSFTTLLRASRKAFDLNGRVYTIRVAAKDNAGNSGANFTRVIVPHNH